MVRFPLAIGAALLATAPAALARTTPPSDPVLARSGGVTVTAGQLQALVAALPPEQAKGIGADAAALAELLRSEAVQQTLLAQAHQKGFDRKPDVAAAASRARDAVIVQRFVASQLPPQPAPTEAQIGAAYDANKARFMLPRLYHLAQIFVAVPSNAAASLVEQKRQGLLAVRSRLAGGSGGFADSARQMSDDKRSRQSGGDLGWLREDALVEPIKGAIAGMQEGSVSDPLRTPDGWHLIHLVATKPAGPAPIEQVRPSIVSALVQQQQQAAVRSYLDGLLGKNPVEIDQPALDRMAKQAAAK